MQDPSSALQLQSLDHPRRRHSQVRTSKYTARLILLLYLRVALDRVAPMFHLMVCHVGTATRLAIGQEIVHIPGRTTTRSRTIPVDVKDMCTIPPWKRFPLVKWSRLVCFS